MIIAGIDEVGRGPLAGPVVAAAVSFSEGLVSPEFKDSKQLSDKKREVLVSKIDKACIDWSLVAIGPKTIDKINIREATKLAMSKALAELEVDMAIIDGNMLIDSYIKQQAIIKGDSLRAEIGAASILAKVWRDRWMRAIDSYFPEFGFARHVGYPTKQHREAIVSCGTTPIHRLSFKGAREYQNNRYELSKELPGHCLQEVAVFTKKKDPGLFIP